MSASERDINELPDELLEFIFGHMPPYKDLQSCALVCKRWTDIVRSEYNRGTRVVERVFVVVVAICWWH